MIATEDRGPQVEQAEILVAVVQRHVALAGALPAVGQRIVERHVLRIVHLQPPTPRLHLLQQRAHISLAPVAIVVVEHQHGDVVLALGIVVEQVVAVALQHAAAPDVVEQAVGVGNAAVALQQTGARQVMDNPLDVTVAHPLEPQMDGLVQPVEHQIGVAIVAHLIIGESHIVQRPKLPVHIVGQRVLYILQRTLRQRNATVGLAVAVDESLLVQTVHDRPPERVHIDLFPAGHKQQKRRSKDQFCIQFHGAKIRRIFKTAQFFLFSPTCCSG